MVMAASMAERMGMLSQDDKTDISRLLESVNLPTKRPALNSNDFLESMKRDKKVQDGEIRLILLESIGRAVISNDYPNEILMETISE